MEKHASEESVVAMLKLCKKIDEANLELEVLPGWQVLPITEWFPGYVQTWLQQLGGQMEQFAEDICYDEEWEEVDENSYFSFSVQEVFKRILDPLGWIEKQRYIDPVAHGVAQGRTYQTIYAEDVVGKALVKYCDCVFESFMRSFPLLQEKLREHMRALFDPEQPAPKSAKLVIVSGDVASEEADEAAAEEAAPPAKGSRIGKSPRKLLGKKKEPKKYRSDWKKEVDMSLGEADVTGDVRHIALPVLSPPPPRSSLSWSF